MGWEVSSKLRSGAKQNPGILRPKALRYRPAVWRGKGGLQPPLWLEFRRAMNVTDLWRFSNSFNYKCKQETIEN